MKKVLILLVGILILVLIIFFMKDEIFSFISIKKYEHKYNNINLIEKTLNFDKNQKIIEENAIDINGFKINLSDFNYNNNDKKLNFNLTFKGQNNLNDVSYILRVYNTEYCLGDKFNGNITLDSGIEYIISYDKFYEKNFGIQIKKIDMASNTIIENDLLNKSQMLKQNELLENGEIMHKISFELPEEFNIKDSLKIELFDLNYQNIGNQTVYQPQGVLTQIQYTIDLVES